MLSLTNRFKNGSDCLLQPINGLKLAEYDNIRLLFSTTISER